MGTHSVFTSYVYKRNQKLWRTLNFFQAQLVWNTTSHEISWSLADVDICFSRLNLVLSLVARTQLKNDNSAFSISVTVLLDACMELHHSPNDSSFSPIRCWACSVPAWCCAGGLTTRHTSCWSQPIAMHERGPGIWRQLLWTSPP